jgi:hypothetical protein
VKKEEIRKELIKAAVKNMREFGYEYADEENVITDEVYSRFFVSMLKENKGHSASIDEVINELLAECESPKKEAP